MKRLFVTGGHGFVGQWIQRLAPTIRERHGYEIAVPPADFELLDPAQVDMQLSAFRPDAVLHLAAQSSVAQSFRDPEATLRINVIGTLRLFEGIKRAGLEPRIVYVSSGDVYGKVPEAEMPVLEERALHPRNPYAVSKVAAEALCFQWSRTEGLSVVVARPFNHVGAGQSDAFVLPGFARQVAMIAAGRQEPVVEVGDIDVSRDFLHVSDVVEGYLALLGNAEPGEVYNICSGRDLRLRDLLQRLLQLAGVRAQVRQNPARLRPDEQRVVRGNNAKLRALGWAPSTRLDGALAEILADWKSRIVAA